MEVKADRIFVVGASGDIGCGIVTGLVEKRIHTTAYVRDESKAKKIFSKEMNTGYLKLVIGDYSTMDVFSENIEGHSRLFILIFSDPTKPTSMKDIKGNFAKIAYEKGVQQIVDLSSFTVRHVGRQGIIGYSHTTAEEILWNIADEKPETRSLVVLRPGAFMTNHLKLDNFTVKNFNKLVSVGLPSSITTWIDTKDISECAVIILTDPIEKHDRLIYEMGSEALTNEQRANIFSEVLRKSIIYEQESPEKFYKTMIEHGLNHSLAYDYITLTLDRNRCSETPQLSILIGRPLRTVKDWLKDNIHHFQ